jgi:RimJ/RimL family protein N-acetyltransferase
MPSPARPDPPLADGEIVLRELTPDDAEAVASAVDERVLEFAYGGQMALDEPVVARPFIEQALEADDCVLLGVFGGDGELLGSTLLWRLDLRYGQCGELGYWLAPTARGRGIASRAARLTCEWGFHVLGLHRIEALTNPENTESEEVVRRLGFTSEGVWRGSELRDGGYVDNHVWSLLATDARVA